MLEVTNFRSGAVLNAQHGVENAGGLAIVIEGLADPCMKVTVNDVPASRMDRKFSAPVTLTEKINTVTVKGASQYGDFIQELTLFWDKQSYKRYTFFIDDNVFFLTDIARERPASLFDHFYLKHLKHLHDTYGTTFTLNLFYRDDHDPEHFELKDFPDCYKSEFQENCSWLRLSFHAYSEFPDRPYQHAAAEKLQADYELVYNEVCRFAGPGSYEPAQVIHWGMTHPDNFEVLKKQGMNMLCGCFVEAATYVGEEVNHKNQVCDIGFYYEKDVAMYVKDGKVFYDRFADMLVHYTDLCCNLTPQEDIRKQLNTFMNSPVHSDTIILMTHEQYCYPRYAAYIPDHLERMELACAMVTEKGYKPAWFAQGVFGNMSWEK